MAAKSLKIKNKSMFYSNDMIQLNNFDSQLLKTNLFQKFILMKDFLQNYNIK